MGWTSDDFFGASMTVTIPQGSTGNKTYTANWGEILTFNLPNDVTLVMHKIPAGVFVMGKKMAVPRITFAPGYSYKRLLYRQVRGYLRPVFCHNEYQSVCT